jgi:hypothetical protein
MGYQGWRVLLILYSMLTFFELFLWIYAVYYAWIFVIPNMIMALVSLRQMKRANHDR